MVPVETVRRDSQHQKWGTGGGGGGVLIELGFAMVLRGHKSGESVSLGKGHSFTRGYHWP